MKKKGFPNIEHFIGEIARQQAPSHHPDASMDDIVKERIRGQNATAEYIRDLWNQFGQDRGEAKLVEFPADAPAYAHAIPSRKNVLITIPPANGTPNETRGIIGHLDNAPVNLRSYERMGKRPGEIRWHRQKKHVLYGWGAYDMQGGNYGTIRGSVEADLSDSQAETVIAFACDEEGISAGAYALARHQDVKRMACIASPEIAVMTKQVRDELLPITIGRNGRFGVKITCNGLGMHAGEVDQQDKPFLTKNLQAIAISVLEKFERTVLRPHPDTSGGMTLSPKITVTGWRSQDEESLTTPARATLNANVFTAHPDDTPDLMVERMRNAMSQVINMLPFHPDIEDFPRFIENAITVELEDRHVLHYGRTPFAEPWRDDSEDPYFTSMERIVMEGYRKSAALIPEIFGGMEVLPKSGIQTMLDSGVSDENVYAALLNVPIANVHLRGGRAHQPGEWLDIRSVPYWQYVVQEYMTAKGRLTHGE